MEDVLVCLIFLVLLVVAGVSSRLMAAFPLPLIQIALGSLIGFLFPHFHAGFNPELFMLLFIPPLLFIDSWHFPQREFLHNKRPIIMLSLGLVFFTVAGIGYLLHWLLPFIPLAACFALAAAFAGRRAIEKKLQTLNLNKTEQEAAICRQVAQPLIANLNQLTNSNIGNGSEKDGGILALSVEQELRLVALEAARQELRLLRKKGKINNATMMAIIGRLDLRQFSLMGDRKNFNFKKP